MDCSVLHIPGLPDTAFERNCIKMNAQQGLDAHGNPLNGAAPPTNGNSSFLGIPIPGSDWWRHMMFRIGEVVLGIAMVVIGVKTFTTGSPTITLVNKTAKKLAS